MKRTVLIGLLVGLLATACGSSGGDGEGGGGGGGWQGGDPPPAVGPSVTLDDRGGVVAVTDPASPLHGVSVTVPPRALAAPTRITIAPSPAPTLDPNTERPLGLGPIVSLEPDGTTFVQPVTVSIPLPPGVPPDGVAAARFGSTPMWREVEGSRAVAVGDDHARVVFETNHFSLYRAIVVDAVAVPVWNQGPAPLDVGVAAWRPAGSDGFAPVPLDLAEKRLVLSDVYNTVSFALLPGEYLFEGTWEGGAAPVCLVATVTEEGAAPVRFTDETPACVRPEVTLTADTLTVRHGEEVALDATATGSVSASLDWYWTRSGGAVSGSQSGQMAPGDTVSATWTAPNRTGEFRVWFTAYDQTGTFGEGAVVITVTGPNQRPEVASLVADPVVIEPGADEGLRSAITVPVPPDAAAEQGITLLTATASDPDGDALALAWDHALPGNFYDSATGVRLGRQEDTGLVVYEGTDVPYDAATVYYMAPPRSYVVGDGVGGGALGGAGALQPNFPLGFYVGVRVVASDGDLWDDAWTLFHVVPPPDALVDDGGDDGGGGDGPDAGGTDPTDTGGGGGGGGDARGSCHVSSLCTNYVGSSFASGYNGPEVCATMGGTWRDGPCPTAGAVGACRTFVGTDVEQSLVWYPESPSQEDIDEMATECAAMPPSAGGPGVWQRPYRP